MSIAVREMKPLRDRIGVIGLGAMGGALLKGIIGIGVSPEGIIGADASEFRLREAAERYGIAAAAANREVAGKARLIFLAVKPQDMPAVLHSIDSAVSGEHLLISVAAGISISHIAGLISEQAGIIRVMPNICCLAGEGAIALSRGLNVSDHDLKQVISWLESLGMVRIVPEKLLDAVTGLSGSGPAYIFAMIEALMDGGVLVGLPRDLARDLAVQTVFGAVKMARSSGEHPAVLREMVTSPGGTTAAGLFALESGGFKVAVMQAVKAAAIRSGELGS
jgi:pyrroline-5-carboxylate reductase